MRHLAACSILLVFPLSPLAAADPETPAATQSDETKREEALEALLAERESPEALRRAIIKARDAGVGEQAVFEARFLFLVDRRDDGGIAALLPDFNKLDAGFKLSESGVFATREDWQAVGEYIKALVALKQGDKDAFKRHITEAFWLSPQQGAAFAPHIEKLRLDDAMRSLKIDFAREFKTNIGGEAQSLKKIMGERKALLLHFWSPWSDGSEAGMPDFTATARLLETNGVAVASVVAGHSPKLLKDAAESIKDIGAKPPGAWIVDDREDPLQRLFKVRGYPTMVLLTATGEVRFNGDPADGELWSALAAINPAIRRPALEGGAETPEP